MFKLLAVAFWVLLFIIAFRLIYKNILEDYIKKEMNDNGSNSEKQAIKSNLSKGENADES